MTAYTITRDVPIPTGRTYGSFDYAALPLGTLQVGESFFIKREDMGNRSFAGIASAVRQRAMRTHKIRVRTEIRRPERHPEPCDGLRVWRES